MEYLLGLHRIVEKSGPAYLSLIPSGISELTQEKHPIVKKAEEIRVKINNLAKMLEKPHSKREYNRSKLKDTCDKALKKINSHLEKYAENPEKLKQNFEKNQEFLIKLDDVIESITAKLKTRIEVDMSQFKTPIIEPDSPRGVTELPNTQANELGQGNSRRGPNH